MSVPHPAQKSIKSGSKTLRPQTLSHLEENISRYGPRQTFLNRLWWLRDRTVWQGDIEIRGWWWLGVWIRAWSPGFSSWQLPPPKKNPPWKGDRGSAAYRTGEPASFSSDRAVNAKRTNSPVDKRPDEPNWPFSKVWLVIEHTKKRKFCILRHQGSANQIKTQSHPNGWHLENKQRQTLARVRVAAGERRVSPAVVESIVEVPQRKR